MSGSHPRDFERELRPSITDVPPDSVVLQLDVVDALLARGGEEKMFQRMKLTDEDIRQVAEIRSERLEELKHLEASHAKVTSDTSGKYVTIDAFPEERRLWLASLEAGLRKQLGDDRAVIIARMISFSDNDEDLGIYRRELHVRPPKVDGGKILIEEKSFNDRNQHIDSDYEEVADQSKSRWSHLLEFDME